MSESEGQLQDYSVDQLGGFVVMVAGAIGSLLLVVWQSKCHCRMNLCYIFQCERRPPSEEEMKSLKDQANALKDKKKDDKGLKETKSNEEDEEDEESPVMKERIIPEKKKTIENNQSGDVENLISN